MAYRGLAYPVIAEYKEDKNGTAYYQNGIVLGKAMTVELKPAYEDISEYNDINNTDQEQEFSYADIILKVDDTEEKAGVFLGFEQKNDSIVYSDILLAKHVGIGLLMKRRQGSTTLYTVLWLVKAKLWEGDSTRETMSDSIEYNTPEYTGRAYPADDGNWKIKKTFETKKQAIEWLKETAKIKEEE